MSEQDTKDYKSPIAEDIEATGNFFSRVDEKLTITILSTSIIALITYLILR
jgi:hypothetical protein